MLFMKVLSQILMNFSFQKYDFGNKNVIVIYVPVPQLRDYHRVHSKLVRELEKKFSGSHVVILAKVRIEFR